MIYDYLNLLLDYNECATGQYCGTNSICKNTIGSFTCTCKLGYTGDGVVCVKKDDTNGTFTHLKSIFISPSFFQIKSVKCSSTSVLYL